MVSGFLNATGGRLGLIGMIYLLGLPGEPGIRGTLPKSVLFVEVELYKVLDYAKVKKIT